MLCTDEPSNAPLDKNVPSTTDIYTVKPPKPVEVQKSYFSLFRSLISMERDCICKDREGVILAILDGLTDYEMMDLLITLKQINDKGVKDVGLTEISSFVVHCMQCSL